jgi:hypothetical protein
VETKLKTILITLQIIDLLTTIIGLQHPHFEEVNPLLKTAIEAFNYFGLIFVKTALMLLIWKFLQNKYLLIFGIIVTALVVIRNLNLLYIVFIS